MVIRLYKLNLDYAINKKLVVFSNIEIDFNNLERYLIVSGEMLKKS